MDSVTYDSLDFEHMVLQDRYYDVRLLELRALAARLTRLGASEGTTEGRLVVFE